MPSSPMVCAPLCPIVAALLATASSCPHIGYGANEDDDGDNGRADDGDDQAYDEGGDEADNDYYEDDQDDDDEA